MTVRKSVTVVVIAVATVGFCDGAAWIAVAVLIVAVDPSVTVVVGAVVAYF